MPTAGPPLVGARPSAFVGSVRRDVPPRAVRVDHGTVPGLVVDGAPRVYADGSALSRYLPGAPHRADWLLWARRNGPRLLTSQVGVSELRGTARMHGADALDVAWRALLEIETIRLSDQAVARAATVVDELPAFVAVHVGAALTHRDVVAVATYDPRLARAADLDGKDVLAPGLPPRWWETAQVARGA